jgi:HK97 family phage major capsid protein
MPASVDHYLEQAQQIITDPSQHFSKEREAMVRSLARLAEIASGNGQRKTDIPLEFRQWLATGRGWKPEQRDIGTGTGAYPGGSGFPIPLEFEAMVFQSMRAADDLWSPDVSSTFQTNGGGPWSAPCADDSQEEAEPVTENTLSDQQDIALGQVSFPKAVTYRSKGILVSQEILQDSAIDIPGLLATTFGVRFQRRIGRTVLVPALVAAAAVVRVATGAAAADQAPGSDGKTSVSSDDLAFALGQLDEAYAEFASWAMNRATLAALYGLRTSTGALVFKERVDANTGAPLILGIPVRLCPSMQSLGAGNTPILLGALKRLAIRTVRGGLYLMRSDERYPEQGQVWFEAFLRCNAGIAWYGSNPSTPAPIVAIQNAS